MTAPIEPREMSADNIARVHRLAHDSHIQYRDDVLGLLAHIAWQSNKLVEAHAEATTLRERAARMEGLLGRCAALLQAKISGWPTLRQERVRLEGEITTILSATAEGKAGRDERIVGMEAVNMTEDYDKPDAASEAVEFAREHMPMFAALTGMDDAASGAKARCGVCRDTKTVLVEGNPETCASCDDERAGGAKAKHDCGCPDSTHQGCERGADERAGGEQVDDRTTGDVSAGAVVATSNDLGMSEKGPPTAPSERPSDAFHYSDNPEVARWQNEFELMRERAEVAERCLELAREGRDAFRDRAYAAEERLAEAERARDAAERERDSNFLSFQQASARIRALAQTIRDNTQGPNKAGLSLEEYVDRLFAERDAAEKRAKELEEVSGIIQRTLAESVEQTVKSDALYRETAHERDQLREQLAAATAGEVRVHWEREGRDDRGEWHEQTIEIPTAEEARSGLRANERIVEVTERRRVLPREESEAK